jgi:hypothetical protein
LLLGAVTFFRIFKNRPMPLTSQMPTSREFGSRPVVRIERQLSQRVQAS